MKKPLVLKDVLHIASYLPMMGLMKLGDRLGYGKQMTGFILKRISMSKLQTKAFGDYQPTEHDVFVATFVKSGTNWMMQIAQQIAHYGAAEFEHIHDVVPWPDAPMVPLISLLDPRPHMQSPTGLRIIKTHIKAHYVPYDEKAKYITVIRDPKEVFVSSYHFFGGILKVLEHVTISDWFDLLLSNQASLGGAWVAHTASFWAWRARPNVLVMTYNEMKKDPRRAIERVVDLMGVSLTELQFEEVVKRSSFAYMKQHERQFAPLQFVFAKPVKQVKMMRSGQSGTSGELISAAQQAAIDDFCRDSLRKLGSDFPYNEVFVEEG